VFQRKTSGSVVCPSCGSLVGVRDDKCYSCGRANPSLWGFAPALRRLGAEFGFTEIVIGACTVLYGLSLLVSGSDIEIQNGLGFLVPSSRALLFFGMSGAYPVFVLGEWWTPLTASWVHHNLLHILFNMMWVRQLCPVVSDLIGPSRTVIVYIVAGVAGFVLSSVAGYALAGLAIPFLSPGANTLGASAAIFGLLGALVHYGRKSGSSLIHTEAKGYAVLLFVFGLIMPGIDNYAHAGGFLGGYAASAVMNPLTRERGDHMLVALALIAATLIAIGLSLVRGFQLFGLTIVTFS
jgi:rhomboid protease GluP